MAKGIFTESPCEGAPFNQSGAFAGIPLFDFHPAVAKALKLAAAISRQKRFHCSASIWRLIVRSSRVCSSSS